MDNIIIDKILSKIKQTSSPSTTDSVDFGLKNIASILFSVSNFHGIPDNTSSEVKIAFIDGGNAAIFDSPTLCIQFIRIYHTIYSNNKRISSGKDEFYLIVSTIKENNDLLYDCSLIPSTLNTLTESFFSSEFRFNSLNPKLRTGDSRIKISTIPGQIRRLAELSTALLLQDRLNNNDAIVIDGDLDYKTDDELKLLNAIRSISTSKGICVCGLSKTSSLLTKTGASVPFILNTLTSLPVWHYYPVAENISFVKLNSNSHHVFRLDSFSHPSILPELVNNSRDAVFMGYPYGLIDADRFARVSNEEADYHRAKLFAKAGSAAERLRALSSASDAHSILDNIL